MSAFASLSLTNNAGTAVVFSPISKDANGVALWMAPGSVFDAQCRITMGVSYPKGSNKVRAKQKVVVPIMDTLDATKKVDEIVIEVNFQLPKNASSTLRLDARKYADLLVQNAVTTALVTNFEAITG